MGAHRPCSSRAFAASQIIHLDTLFKQHHQLIGLMWSLFVLLARLGWCCTLLPSQRSCLFTGQLTATTVLWPNSGPSKAHTKRKPCPTKNYLPLMRRWLNCSARMMIIQKRGNKKSLFFSLELDGGGVSQLLSAQSSARTRTQSMCR